MSGRVRRVEKFGVFVEVEGNSSVVGLAHISELADGAVKDISALFKPKQVSYCLPLLVAPTVKYASCVRRLAAPVCSVGQWGCGCVCVCV